MREWFRPLSYLLVVCVMLTVIPGTALAKPLSGNATQPGGVNRTDVKNGLQVDLYLNHETAQIAAADLDAVSFGGGVVTGAAAAAKKIGPWTVVGAGAVFQTWARAGAKISSRDHGDGVIIRTFGGIPYRVDSQ